MNDETFLSTADWNRRGARLHAALLFAIMLILGVPGLLLMNLVDNTVVIVIGGVLALIAISTIPEMGKSIAEGFGSGKDL